MPIKGCWYIPHRVIYVQLKGELRDEMKEEVEMIILSYLNHSSASIVHVLSDVRFLRKPGLLEQLYLDHPKLGFNIMFGAQPGYRRVQQLPYREFLTADAALLFLQHADSTLPDLQAFRHIFMEEADAV